MSGVVALSADRPLLHRNVLLAVTGSVAACKADRVIRALVDAGADVQVLLTRDGARFFPPATAGALTDRPVLTHQFEGVPPGSMPHIDVKRWADALLVAPATANRLLQMEHPTASDTLATVLRAFGGPVLYAPAMNPDMWERPDLQAVVEKHAERVVRPDPGEMACGDVGPGRLTDPSRIVDRLAERLWPPLLEGARWVVSAGPTREPWDAIRYLSNRSSGRMGEALARIGSLLGGTLHLVTGARRAHYPNGLYETTRIETARDMLDALEETLDGASGYIGAAAVSDYRPVPAEGKIPSGGNPALELEHNPDLISELGSSHPTLRRIGFSADDRQDPGRALEKADEKGLDAVVFNAIDQEAGGFGHARNTLTVCVPPEGIHRLGNRSKLAAALQVWLWLLHYDLA